MADNNVRYQEEHNDLEAIVKTKHGRRYLWHLVVDSCCEDERSLCDHFGLALREGMARVGWRILKAIRELPDGFVYEKLMREEARAPTEIDDDEEDFEIAEGDELDV